MLPSTRTSCVTTARLWEDHGGYADAKPILDTHLMLRESLGLLRTQSHGDWSTVIVLLGEGRWALATAELVRVHAQLRARTDGLPPDLRHFPYVWLVVLLGLPSVDLSDEAVFSHAGGLQVLICAMHHFVQAQPDAPCIALHRMLVRMHASLRLQLLLYLVHTDVQLSSEMLRTLNLVIYQTQSTHDVLRAIYHSPTAPPQNHLLNVGLLPAIADGSMEDVISVAFVVLPLDGCDGLLWCILSIFREVGLFAVNCNNLAMQLSNALARCPAAAPPLTALMHVLVAELILRAGLDSSACCALLESVSAADELLYTGVTASLGRDGRWPDASVVHCMRGIAEDYRQRTVRERSRDQAELAERPHVLSSMLAALARFPPPLLDAVDHVDELALECCCTCEEPCVLEGARLLMERLQRPALRVLARCSDASLPRTAARLIAHWEVWCDHVQTLSELHEAICHSNLRRIDVERAWARLSSMLKDDVGVDPCPITLELPCEPVACSDGRTYERRAIERWVEEHGGTSPLTRESLTVIGVDMTALRRMDAQLWAAAAATMERERITRYAFSEVRSPKPSLGGQLHRSWP